MRVFNDPIPKHKMPQFHELMCSTNSKYISKPMEWKNYYRVDYEPTAEFVELWRRCNITITETRKDQWYRRLYRRCKAVFNNIAG